MYFDLAKSSKTDFFVSVLFICYEELHFWSNSLSV